MANEPQNLMGWQERGSTGCEESSDVKVERHRPGDPEVAAIQLTTPGSLPSSAIVYRIEALTLHITEHNESQVGPACVFGIANSR